MVTSSELTLIVEDFEACAKVGRVVQKRGDYSEAEVENLWLNGELLDKTDKLTACLEFLAEDREEAEKFKQERDALQARMDKVAEAEANIEKTKRELAEANQKAKLAEEVPRLRKSLEEVKVENQGLRRQVTSYKDKLGSVEERLKKSEPERDEALFFKRQSAKYSAVLAVSSFHNAVAQVKMLHPDLKLFLVHRLT